MKIVRGSAISPQHTFLEVRSAPQEPEAPVGKHGERSRKLAKTAVYTVCVRVRVGEKGE